MKLPLSKISKIPLTTKILVYPQSIRQSQTLKKQNSSVHQEKTLCHDFRRYTVHKSIKCFLAEKAGRLVWKNLINLLYLREMIQRERPVRWNRPTQIKSQRGVPKLIGCLQLTHLTYQMGSTITLPTFFYLSYPKIEKRLIPSLIQDTWKAIIKVLSIMAAKIIQ